MSDEGEFILRRMPPGLIGESAAASRICPVCSWVFNDTDPDTLVNRHVNACLDQTAGIQDLELQKVPVKTENLTLHDGNITRNLPCPGDDTDVLSTIFCDNMISTLMCPICQKDISRLNAHMQQVHVTKCLFAQGNAFKARKKRSGKPVRDLGKFECQICGKRICSEKQYQKHLKSCAKKNNVPISQILMLLRQEEAKRQENARAGISNENASLSSNEYDAYSSKRKCPAKPLNKYTTSVTIQPAKAEDILSKFRRIAEQSNLYHLSQSSPQHVARTKVQCYTCKEFDSAEGGLRRYRFAKADPNFFSPTDGTPNVSRTGFWSVSASCNVDYGNGLVKALQKYDLVDGHAAVKGCIEMKTYPGQHMTSSSVTKGYTGSDVAISSSFSNLKHIVMGIENERRSVEESLEMASLTETQLEKVDILLDLATENAVQESIGVGTGFVRSLKPDSWKTRLSDLEMSSRTKALGDFLRMLESSTYSDVLIKCKGGFSLPAHRAVICARCDRLGKLMMDGTSVLELTDCSPEAVGALLKFLYGCVIDFGVNISSEVHGLAKRLDLKDLVNACELLDPCLKDIIGNEEVLSNEAKSLGDSTIPSARELVSTFWESQNVAGDSDGDSVVGSIEDDIGQDSCFSDDELELMQDMFRTQVVRSQCSDPGKELPSKIRDGGIVNTELSKSRSSSGEMRREFDSSVAKLNESDDQVFCDADCRNPAPLASTDASDIACGQIEINVSGMKTFSNKRNSLNGASEMKVHLALSSTSSIGTSPQRVTKYAPILSSPHNEILNNSAANLFDLSAMELNVSGDENSFACQPLEELSVKNMEAIGVTDERDFRRANTSILSQAGGVSSPQSPSPSLLFTPMPVVCETPVLMDHCRLPLISSAAENNASELDLCSSGEITHDTSMLSENANSSCSGLARTDGKHGHDNNSMLDPLNGSVELNDAIAKSSQALSSKDLSSLSSLAYVRPHSLYGDVHVSPSLRSPLAQTCNAVSNSFTASSRSFRETKDGNDESFDTRPVDPATDQAIVEPDHYPGSETSISDSDSEKSFSEWLSASKRKRTASGRSNCTFPRHLGQHMVPSKRRRTCSSADEAVQASINLSGSRQRGSSLLHERTNEEGSSDIAHAKKDWDRSSLDASRNSTGPIQSCDSKHSWGPTTDADRTPKSGKCISPKITTWEDDTISQVEANCDAHSDSYWDVDDGGFNCDVDINCPVLQSDDGCLKNLGEVSGSPEGLRSDTVGIEGISGSSRTCVSSGIFESAKELLDKSDLPAQESACSVTDGQIESNLSSSTQDSDGEDRLLSTNFECGRPDAPSSADKPDVRVARMTDRSALLRVQETADKDQASGCTPVGKKFPPGCNIHPETSEVITPMPDFASFATPLLRDQIKKFALRPLRKDKMVAKLREIYKFQHNFTNWEEDSVAAAKAGNAEHRNKRVKVAGATRADSCEGSTVVSPNKKNHPPLKEAMDDRSACSKRKFALQKAERLVKSRSENSEKQDARKMFFEFFLRKETYRCKILNYEPLNLDEVYQLVKLELAKQGMKGSREELASFLDEQCICVSKDEAATIPREQQRKRRRKPAVKSSSL